MKTSCHHHLYRDESIEELQKIVNIPKKDITAFKLIRDLYNKTDGTVFKFLYLILLSGECG